MTIRSNLLLVALLAAGCGVRGPVLHPNTHARQAGDEQQKRDVEECRALAKEQVSTGRAAGIARDTAIGSTVGAAGGAVGGAIHGNPGAGAAAGAATGAVVGLLSRLLRPPAPHPAYVALVNRCLQDRGYEVAGWQ